VMVAMHVQCWCRVEHLEWLLKVTLWWSQCMYNVDVVLNIWNDS